MNFLVLRALSNALRSQFKPRMIQAVLLPLLVGFSLFILLMIFAWSPLSDWILETASQWGWVQWIQNLWGGSTTSSWMVGFITVGIIFAFSGISGLSVAAIVVTPMVISMLSKNDFASLAKRGKNANTVSIANAIKVSTIFVLGWLVTLPLWLIPFMSIILSLFWGAYAFSQMCKVDAIVEHATPEERRYILEHHNKGFWMIGLVCALVALIPFMGLVMPVFSILACSHYGLSTLQELRKNQSTEVQKRTAP